MISLRFAWAIALKRTGTRTEAAVDGSCTAIGTRRKTQLLALADAGSQSQELGGSRYVSNAFRVRGDSASSGSRQASLLADHSSEDGGDGT